MPGIEYFLNEDAIEYFESKLDDLEDKLNDKADVIISSASGSIAHFEDGAEADAKSVIAHIEPVQEGSGDPTPDNVRPVSGFTGMNVMRSGKNFIDAVSVWGAEKIVNPLGTVRCYFPKSLIGKQVTISTLVKANSDTASCRIRVRIGETNIDSVPYVKDVSNFVRTQITVIPQSTDDYCTLVSSGANGTYKDVQLELGSTATAYEPYQGETYPIAFPTEAGTVYGGYVDAVKGKLMVDRANITSYSGQALPGEWISDRDVYTPGGTPTTGAQVVYKLAEPVVYNITPQQIATLLGTNNIWNDCNGNTDVEYKADTKLYIEQLTKQTDALNQVNA